LFKDADQIIRAGGKGDRGKGERGGNEGGRKGKRKKDRGPPFSRESRAFRTGRRGRVYKSRKDRVEEGGKNRGGKTPGSEEAARTRRTGPGRHFGRKKEK